MLKPTPGYAKKIIETKNLYLKGSYQENNGATAKYYLYDDTTRLGDKYWIRLNQAYTYSATTNAASPYNGNIVNLIKDMLLVDTVSYGNAGRSFYSSSPNLRGTLELGRASTASFDKASTIFRIKSSDLFTSLEV